ncbi:MAG: integrin alpha [Phycisphaerales bacterium]
MPKPTKKPFNDLQILRQQAGYAFLEAVPALAGIVVLGTIIASTASSFGSRSAADQQPSKSIAASHLSVDELDSEQSPAFIPTPEGAANRHVRVTREYASRLDAMVDRTAVPFHGVPGSDYTGNGNPDIMVTKPSATNILDGTDPTGGFGAVEVWTLWSSSAVLTLNAPNQNDLFAISAKSAGDLDGDGADDIIVGAMIEHGASTLEGGVYVYSGSDGQLLLSIAGMSGEYFGRTVAVVSDADGDGQWDIAASSWAFDEDYQPYGMVSIHSGSDGALIRTFTSELINDGFGYEIISMGDLDGDGASEIAISASLAPGDPFAWGPATGRVHIYHGGPRGTEPQHLTGGDADLIIYNTDPLIDQFAVAIELTADQDNDGVPDLLVTSLIDPGTPSETTAIQIYSSVTGGMLWPVSTPPPGTGREGGGDLPAVDEDGNVILYSHYVSGLGIVGDATRNLKVEQGDLALVMESFGQPSEPGNPVSGDLSLSGLVEMADMAMVVGSMNQSSVILDYVADAHRLLTRWSSLDPYQYGNYITGAPGRVNRSNDPDRTGGDPSDPVMAIPSPSFPGVAHLGSTPGCFNFMSPTPPAPGVCSPLCCVGEPDCCRGDGGGGDGGDGGPDDTGPGGGDDGRRQR